MYARDTTIGEPLPDAASLERQLRSLQERLAFYEGFDRLIQENVAHARELFRLAALEREAAAAAAERAQIESSSRETALRGELEEIAVEIASLAAAVEHLGHRVSVALGTAPDTGAGSAALEQRRSVVVVVHGVPSARTALSLQRFIASLPQVSEVSAREFAGGVLRLDATVCEPIGASHFAAWEDPRSVESLTERPDVVELVLRPAIVERVGA